MKTWNSMNGFGKLKMFFLRTASKMLAASVPVGYGYTGDSRLHMSHDPAGSQYPESTFMIIRKDRKVFEYMGTAHLENGLTLIRLRCIDTETSFYIDSTGFEYLFKPSTLKVKFRMPK